MVNLKDYRAQAEAIKAEVLRLKDMQRQLVPGVKELVEPDVIIIDVWTSTHCRRLGEITKALIQHKASGGRHE